jgi:hypothetical protein
MTARTGARLLEQRPRHLPIHQGRRLRDADPREELEQAILVLLFRGFPVQV